jgi:hypothetical protein
MELDKDLQARQQARHLSRQAESAQKALAQMSQAQLDAIVQAVTDAFEVELSQATADVLEFLQQLRDAQLLEE